MTYEPRPGIALLRVCGAHLLTPTRAAAEECPHILRLSPLGSVIWKLLAKGKSPRDITMICAVLTRRTAEEAEQMLAEYLRDLRDKGFLLEVPDGSES